MAETKSPPRAGGQAVIEGVMMRAPGATSVAVRLPNQKISLLVRPSKSLMERYPILAKPFLRGAVVLIETMMDGVGALQYSAYKAGEVDSTEKASFKDKAAIISTMVVSILLGLLMFVVLPHALSYGIGLITNSRQLIEGQSAGFQLLDGTFKVIILLSYLWIILQFKDVRRVFEYHGAEHQAVYAYESGLEINPENMEKFTTAHPRCGTSLIFVVILVSVLLFAVIFPFIPVMSKNSLINNILVILIKLALVLPIASISYEVIRFAFQHMDTLYGRVLAAPGKWLQLNFTTRRPAKDQQEVGAAALIAAVHCGQCDHCQEKEVEFDSFENFLQTYKEKLCANRG